MKQKLSCPNVGLNTVECSVPQFNTAVGLPTNLVIELLYFCKAKDFYRGYMYIVLMLLDSRSRMVYYVHFLCVILLVAVIMPVGCYAEIRFNIGFLHVHIII